MSEMNEKKQNNKFFTEEYFPPNEHPFEDIFKEHLPKQIILIAIIVVLVIFLFLNLNQIAAFFKRVIEILTPIIVGWVLAFIMAPFYDFLVKRFSKKGDVKIRKFSKHLATIVCTVGLIAIVVGLFFLFVPQLYASIMSFSGRAGGYLKEIRTAIDDIRANANNDILKQLFEQMEVSINDAMKTTTNPDYSKFFTGLFNSFYVSFKVILNAFVGLVVMIYTLNMKEDFSMQIKKVLYAIFRKDIAQKIRTEVSFAKNVFSAFLAGKLLDSLIIGMLCYICCLLMKMPYTPLIAVIVGITNIIPFFGPFIGAVPAFLLILLEEPFSWRPYGFLVFILILQQIDGNIIGPKILGDKTGVGSFWVLFSILLFGGLFGFVGMIIAVPMWAVITRLFDEFVVFRLKEKEYPLTTEEYLRLKEYNKTLSESESKK